MLSYIQQYLIYILAGFIAVLLIVVGVQTVRLSFAHKDNTVLTEKLNAQLAINATNTSTLSKVKSDSDALQQRLDAAQVGILELEKKHSESIRRLISTIPPPTSGKCEDMVTWAKQMAIGRTK